MIKFRRYSAVFLAVFCSLALAACSNKALTVAGKAEAAVSLGCSSAFTIVGQAQTSGLISTADATAVIDVLVSIEQANMQAETATAAIVATPTAAGIAGLVNVLNPIATAITNGINTGLLGVKDAGTKQKITLALTTAQTALTAAIAIVQVVK
jgi:predicted Abi (CAAX) family protease